MLEEKIKETIDTMKRLGMDNLLDGAIIETIRKEFREAGKEAAVKPSKTKKEYNLFFTQNKNGYRTQTVNDWDGLLKQFMADTGIKKINTLLLDNEMNIITKNTIESQIHQLIENISPKTASDIAKKIYLGIENVKVKANKYEIVFQNGKYNLQKKEFIEGDFPSINKLPWDYVANAESELGREVLNRYVGKNIGFDTQIFEAVGVLAAQDKGFNFKKTFFFDGDSDYAKTFLAEDFIQPALGRHNFANIDVAALDDQEVASFINKTAVFDDDMDRGAWDTGVVSRFKKITGSKILKAKVLYQDKFDFTNTATAWINCNGLPELNDTGSGGAIETRMQIIKATVDIKKKYNDPKIYDKVAAKRKEISEWLLKEAMIALGNALDRGHLTVTEASKQAMIENLEYKDTVYAWMKSYNWQGIQGSIKASSLFDLYTDSFHKGGINFGKSRPKEIKSFTKGLRDHKEVFNIVVKKSNGDLKVRPAIAGEVI